VGGGVDLRTSGRIGPCVRGREPSLVREAWSAPVWGSARGLADPVFGGFWGCKVVLKAVDPMIVLRRVWAVHVARPPVRCPAPG